MSSLLSIIHAEGRSKSSSKQVGNPLIAGLLFMSICFALPGCGLMPRDRLPQQPGGPAKARVANVPFYPQDELQCGPAALAMVLGWSGLAVTPADLSPEVFSPGLDGSLQSALIGSARRHGRVAYPVTGSEAMLAELSAGHPVIVLVNLGFFWSPKWHYAVVIGFDQEKGELLLHSGLVAEEHLGYRLFMNIWQRSELWGLLVLPPDVLPATVEPARWLAAVAGLENTEEWAAAAIGYSTALERWQWNFAAWMGLGNSRYAMNDLDGAAAAFRRATLLEPENGMAYNNLAHVLAEQGNRQDALAAARRAVALGGPQVETFMQTLKDIGAMPAR
jgi:hypothetical protein